MIDQETNETLSEFRPVPEDIEQKEKISQTWWVLKHHGQVMKLEFRGKRATALNRDCMSTKMNRSRKIQILHR